MQSRPSAPLAFMLLALLLLAHISLSKAGAPAAIQPLEAAEDRLLGEDTSHRLEAEDEQEIKAELDKLRASPQERRRLIMAAQMLLGRLGYGVGPFDGRFDDKTRRALRYYQQTNKLPDSGELDYQTVKRLIEDTDWLEPLPVQLPVFRFIADAWDASVSAGGTWTIVNGRQAFPLQTTTIECIRTVGRCRESTAMVGEANLLVSILTDDEVERWDEQDIVTKPRTHHCVTETLRLSRSQKTVTRLRRPTVSVSCPDSEGQDVTLLLDSGDKVWDTLSRARKATFRRIMKTGDLNFDKVKE